MMSQRAPGYRFQYQVPPTSSALSSTTAEKPTPAAAGAGTARRTRRPPRPRRRPSRRIDASRPVLHRHVVPFGEVGSPLTSPSIVPRPAAGTHTGPAGAGPGAHGLAGLAGFCQRFFGVTRPRCCGAFAGGLRTARQTNWTMMAPMTEPMMPLGRSLRPSPKMRLPMRPPTNEPIRPTTSASPVIDPPVGGHDDLGQPAREHAEADDPEDEHQPVLADQASSGTMGDTGRRWAGYRLGGRGHGRHGVRPVRSRHPRGPRPGLPGRGTCERPATGQRSGGPRRSASAYSSRRSRFEHLARHVARQRRVADHEVAGQLEVGQLTAAGLEHVFAGERSPGRERHDRRRLAPARRRARRPRRPRPRRRHPPAPARSRPGRR